MGDKFVLQAPAENEEGAWQAIPDNSILKAKVTKVERTLMPFKDKETDEEVWRVKWFFKITEGDFAGRTVNGLTGEKFKKHEDCKLYQWVKTLFDNDLPLEFALDTDDLAGLECEVLVNLVEKERRDGKGMWVNNNVIDVRPPKNAPVSVGSAFGGVDYDEEPF